MQMPQEGPVALVVGYNEHFSHFKPGAVLIWRQIQTYILEHFIVFFIFVMDKLGLGRFK